MSLTVKIFQQVEVVIGGELLVFGSRETPQEVTINGEKFDAQFLLDSDVQTYPVQEVWATGDAGVTDFNVCVIQSDSDVLVEFADHDNTEYFAIGVAADVPLVLTKEQILVSDSAAVLTNGAATTMKSIDRISVQLNDAAGDTANVRVLLLT